MVPLVWRESPVYIGCLAYFSALNRGLLAAVQEGFATNP
jgi:hypothetical protein